MSLMAELLEEGLAVLLGPAMGSRAGDGPLIQLVPGHREAQNMAGRGELEPG